MRYGFIFILLIILFSSFVQFKVFYTNDTNGDSQEVKTDFNQFVRVQATTATYLGKFVRSKDYVTITGKLLDNETGDPLASQIVELYLDDGDNALDRNNDLLIATNKTNATGDFYFRTLINTNFRLGNNTLFVYYDGNITLVPPQGPAQLDYIVTVYAPVDIGVSFSSTQLALFEENVTCRTWIYLDNGTVIAQENLTIESTIILTNESGSYILSSSNLKTDANGYNTTVIHFSYVGNYTVDLKFNVTAHRDLLGDFIVSEYQYFNESGVLTGTEYSEAKGKFIVYRAIKILLWFGSDTNKKSIVTYRNDSLVQVSGVYYNITGHSETANITLELYDSRNTLVESATIEAINGIISHTFSISYQNYTVGQYIIRAHDNDTTTVDLVETLSMEVRSILSINITDIAGVEDKAVQAGSRISVSGIVSDLFSKEILSSSSINIYIPDYYNESIAETTTDAEGRFTLSFALPDSVTSRTLDIILSATYSEYYDEGQKIIQLSVFNLFFVNMSINESYYSWAIYHQTIYSPQSLEYTVEENSTVVIVIDLTDDFNQSRYAKIELTAGNVTFYTGEGSHFEVPLLINDTTFYLRIKIDSPELDNPIELAILVNVKKKGGFSATSIIMPIILLAIIGAVIFVSLFAERKTTQTTRTIRYVEKDAKLILEDIKRDITNDDYMAAINKGGGLILRIAKELKGSYPQWMTLREVSKYISDEFPHPVKNTILATLLDIVYVFEKVVYGHKRPTGHDIKKYIEALKIIENYVIPKTKGEG